MEFDDVLSTASGLFHDELLTLEEFDTLRRVDAATVVVCAADESIWTEVALTGATEWSELRKVANSVKLELAESWNLGDYL
ncbi:hypothetical protein [Streptomyces sp. NPDC101132]|uniref:hypothetical protein n=1 Tax=Streptomyces sp. NPDC101132 TaxID=3366110 RepID=UPI00380426A6